MQARQTVSAPARSSQVSSVSTILYGGAIRLDFDSKSHGYTVTDLSTNSVHEAPSVTQILGVIGGSKIWGLKQWAANLTSDYIREVKYSESGFGRCRGWIGAPDYARYNPDPSRCLNASKIVSEPPTNCWLAEAEGRRYWEIMAAPGSSIRIESIQSAGMCPFRTSLYQMMRNRVLADELVRHDESAWADFAVCRHPANDAVTILDEPIFAGQNAIEAFRSLSSAEALLDWDARKVVEVIASTDHILSDWAGWMRARYFG